MTSRVIMLRTQVFAIYAYFLSYAFSRARLFLDLIFFRNLRKGKPTPPGIGISSSPYAYVAPRNHRGRCPMEPCPSRYFVLYRDSWRRAALNCGVPPRMQFPATASRALFTVSIIWDDAYHSWQIKKLRSMSAFGDEDVHWSMRTKSSIAPLT